MVAICSPDIARDTREFAEVPSLHEAASKGMGSDLTHFVALNFRCTVCTREHAPESSQFETAVSHY